MWSVHTAIVKGDVVFLTLAAGSDVSSPEQETAYRIGFYTGVLLGAFIAGAIVGLLPLAVARWRGHRTFALVSWVSCVLANLVLGIFLSIPVALVLTAVALCLGKPAPREDVLPPQTVSTDQRCRPHAGLVQDPSLLSAGSPLGSGARAASAHEAQSARA